MARRLALLLSTAAVMACSSGCNDSPPGAPALLPDGGDDAAPPPGPDRNWERPEQAVRQGASLTEGTKSREPVVAINPTRPDNLVIGVVE